MTGSFFLVLIAIVSDVFWISIFKESDRCVLIVSDGTTFPVGSSFGVDNTGFSNELYKKYPPTINAVIIPYVVIFPASVAPHLIVVAGVDETPMPGGFVPS